MAATAATDRKRRYRVKLVMPAGPDAHYFYGEALAEASGIMDTLRDELAELPEQPAIYLYVDTPLGHVRVA